MTAPTRPTPEPESPTPAAALAAPCLRCGTTGGARISADYPRPRRMRGLCAACGAHVARYGRIEAWPLQTTEHRPAITIICAGCGDSFEAIPSAARSYCTNACYHRATNPEHPAPIPAGLSPIVWPDRARPVWTGLAIAKYPAPTWHTYGPRERRLGEAA